MSGERVDEGHWAATEHLVHALEEIALIAAGSTTANSLPNISRIARQALKAMAPYPEFCHQPELCRIAGRCTAEIVCND